MAFIKEHRLVNETTGSYWKIVDVRINYLFKTASIVFGLFKDKATNDSKYDTIDNTKLLIDTKAFNFEKEEDGSFIFDKAAIKGIDMVAFAYDVCKNNPKDDFFKTAVDDIDPIKAL